MNRLEFTVPFAAIQERSRKSGRRWYAPSCGNQRIIGEYALAAAAQQRVESRQTNAVWPSLRDVRLTLLVYGLRGDLDNCVKLVGDSLNGVIWKDDRQVSVIIAERVRTLDSAKMVIAVDELQ